MPPQTSTTTLKTSRAWERIEIIAEINHTKNISEFIYSFCKKFESKVTNVDVLRNRENAMQMIPWLLIMAELVQGEKEHEFWLVPWAVRILLQTDAKMDRSRTEFTDLCFWKEVQKKTFWR